MPNECFFARYFFFINDHVRYPLLLSARDASNIISFWYCTIFCKMVAAIYKGLAHGYATSVLLLHPQWLSNSVSSVCDECVEKKKSLLLDPQCECLYQCRVTSSQCNLIESYQFCKEPVSPIQQKAGRRCDKGSYQPGPW